MDRYAPSTAPPPATLAFRGPVTLVGGGPFSPSAFPAARARSVAVIAADGGADRFAPGDGTVAALIGDMDSVSRLSAWRDDPTCIVIPLAEQDTTDLEKCLYSVEAPLYFAVGFLGGRLDHTLAALHVLLARPDRRVVLLNDEDAAFLAPRRLRLGATPGDRISFLPLGSTIAGASAGLRWPLDGLTLALGGVTSASNQASAHRIEADFDLPAPADAAPSCWSRVLCVVDRTSLPAVIECLALAEEATP